MWWKEKETMLKEDITMLKEDKILSRAEITMLLGKKIRFMEEEIEL